jgi:hypothetical protein
MIMYLGGGGHSKAIQTGIIRIYPPAFSRKFFGKSFVISPANREGYR